METATQDALPHGEQPQQQQPTTAEKRLNETGAEEEPASKRVKTASAEEEGANVSTQIHDGEPSSNGVGVEQSAAPTVDAKAAGRIKGVAPIKAEYLTTVVGPSGGSGGHEVDDDAAEGRNGASDPRDNSSGGGGGKAARKGQKGANKDRSFGRSVDTIRLCPSRMFSDEFSPRECSWGDRCNQCHDLRKYLAEGRRADLESFEGKCPVWEEHGRCNVGWKCRFVKSHMEEIKREDGRKELILLRREDANASEPVKKSGGVENGEGDFGIINVVPGETKRALSRKKTDLSMSERYIKWGDQHNDLVKKINNRQKKGDAAHDNQDDLRAQFVEPPFKPSEKRRIYFGRETPVLAPLTTQGNLPFRRLCVELGAQATYSEMAMGMPLLQGHAPEWALLKAHESETQSPAFRPDSGALLPEGYDHARDLKFSAQISATAPWLATKAVQALTTFVPHMRSIDLNCGCPIDMVFNAGAGSALLEQPMKMERMVRGMNAVSGEVPITCKLRMGVKENQALAVRNIERLAFGAADFRDQLGAPGCAAITLHGRSRQARYKKPADWSYIAECAALVASYNAKRDELTDTARDPDPSTLANNNNGGRMYFLGNGDCYSHVDYHRAVDESRVDTVMIARGALIKPWIFEEIEKGQYLDKSSAERLTYVEKFCRYGMQAWGADEMGIGTTRRFLLEYLSFAHRYVPVGLLEHLPPSLSDRPPAYRGRDDLETLMASDNYRDWIKISEMFLGPAAEGFKFQPKHKSNSYDIEAEG